MVAVWYFAARAVFATEASLARLVVYGAIVVPFTVWTYVQLPSGVKRSLGAILAPGAGANKVGLGMIAAGASTAVGALVWDGNSQGDDILLDVLFVCGALVFGAGCIGTAMTIRDHRRARAS